MEAVTHNALHNPRRYFPSSYCKRRANVRESFWCEIAVNQQFSRIACQIDCRAEVSVSEYDAIATLNL